METRKNEPGSTPEQQIAALEKAFVESENRLKKQQEDLTRRQEHIHRLQHDIRQLQDDYENLRVQKGGFGFKMLAFSGFCGFITGIVICFLFFRPTDHRSEAFRRFQREQLFQVEYAINEGRFEDALKLLSGLKEQPDNELIREELESIRKVTEAARRHCK